MVDTEVPSDVKTLLTDHIESHEQLEALLLLRNHRDGMLDAQRVALELGVSESMAEEALRHLSSQRLLSTVTGPKKARFRYNPETPELDRAIERLDAAHVHQTLEIVKLMTSNAIERLRSRALATFADGFASKSRRGKRR
jgi:DNA-binding transcriptional MocR family regulator